MAFRSIHAFCAFGVLLTAASTALSAPSIARMNVRGFQTGATTTVIIDGADLLPTPRLICGVPITSQVLKPGATATRIQIDVTVDPKAEAGIYNLWLVSGKGVSPRQVVAVDFLPQLPFNPRVEELPVALHGNFAGSKLLVTKFPGKAGEKVTIEVEAQRLGGKEQPVIHLFDPGDHEIGFSLPSAVAHGDARLVATLPADGDYSIRLHDLQYGGAGPFRLKIGSWEYADVAFPPAVQRGKSTNLSLIGEAGIQQHIAFTGGAMDIAPAPWLDPAKASGTRPIVYVSDFPEMIEDQEKQSPHDLGDIKPPFAVSGKLSKPGEQDRYTIEVASESSLQLSVMAAQVGSPMDAVLEVRNTKGDLLGSNDDEPGSSDPRLDFKVPKGMTSLIVGVKDAYGRGGDACVYRLIVLPGAEKPIAEKPIVKKPTAKKTVVKKPVVTETGLADFDLYLEDDAWSPTSSAPYLVKVMARRRGYQGPIALRLADAPGGIAMQRGQIPAGADAALVVIDSKAEASDSMPAAISHLTGQGQDGDRPLVRTAGLEQHPLGELQPWLRNDVVVVAGEKSEGGFTAALGGESAEIEGVLAQKITLAVKCNRPLGFDGLVRLTLMTSQIIPLLRNQNTPDPARTLRTELAKVEIPADAKAQAAWDAKIAAETALAAAQKALEAAEKAEKAADAKQAAADKAAQAAKAKKAAADKVVPKAGTTAPATTPATGVKAIESAEAKATNAAAVKVKQAADAVTKAQAAAEKAATGAKNSLDVALLVPADLTLGHYDLAFRAELLGRDGRTVVATQFTAIRGMNAVSPVAVTLDGSGDLEAQLNPKSGGEIKLSGKVERHAGFTGEVTVSFEGLPKGINEPKIVVPVDKSEWKADIKIPPAVEAGETRGIKLFATAKPDPKVVAIVRSRDVELTLKIAKSKAPDKSAK